MADRLTLSASTAWEGPRLLACPFWKHSPDSYRECGQRKLRKLSRVKQHLNLYHRQPFFCSACMDIFPTESARLDHERARTCPKRDLVEPAGLSREQLTALHRRPPKDLTVEQQWFTVWDIVFPRTERPSSAYIDTDVSEDLISFREYIATSIPRRATEKLESDLRQLQTRPEQRESIQRVIQDCLEEAYEDWITEFRASRSRRASLSRPPRPQIHPPSPVYSSLPSSCFSSSHNSTSTTPSFGPITPTRFRNALSAEDVPVFPELASQTQSIPNTEASGPVSYPIQPNHPVTPKSILFSQGRMPKQPSGTATRINPVALSNIPGS